MAKKYLDDSGLLYFWGQIKAYVTSVALTSSDKGVANGVCPLNANGKVDSSYLPTYNGGVS